MFVLLNLLYATQDMTQRAMHGDSSLKLQTMGILWEPRPLRGSISCTRPVEQSCSLFCGEPKTEPGAGPGAGRLREATSPNTCTRALVVSPGVELARTEAGMRRLGSAELRQTVSLAAGASRKSSELPQPGGRRRAQTAALPPGTAL